MYSGFKSSIYKSKRCEDKVVALSREHLAQPEEPTGCEADKKYLIHYCVEDGVELSDLENLLMASADEHRISKEILGKDLGDLRKEYKSVERK